MSRESTYLAWPQRFAPNRAALFVHNEISIDAAPELVCHLLLASPRWSRWFYDAQFVRIRQPAGVTRCSLAKCSAGHHISFR